MSPPVLSARHLSKRFGSVQALADVSVDFLPGEIHGIIGENGAGKSTFMKLLAGVEKPDAGEILVPDAAGALAPVRFRTPLDAARHGIAMIHQELSGAPDLSVSANLFLGREPSRFGVLGLAAMRAETARWLDALGGGISPDDRLGDLSVAQQQRVEIAKALSQNARLLILDEPTAVLPADDCERLFALLEDLRRQGVALAFISHHLEEVVRLCDRITVLRDGRLSARLGPFAAAKGESVPPPGGAESVPCRCEVQTGESVPSPGGRVAESVPCRSEVQTGESVPSSGGHVAESVPCHGEAQTGESVPSSGGRVAESVPCHGEAQTGESVPSSGGHVAESVPCRGEAKMRKTEESVPNAYCFGAEKSAPCLNRETGESVPCRGEAQTGESVLSSGGRVAESVPCRGEAQTGESVPRPSERDLAALMVGRPMDSYFPPLRPLPPESVPPALPALAVEHWTTPDVADITLSIRPGEILGLEGLVGSGRTEFAESLFGLRPGTGSLSLFGERYVPSSPLHALRSGLAYLPEDRKGAGLAVDLPIRENLSMAALRDFGRARIDLARERRAAADSVAAFGIRTPDPELPVSSLSGGNQQKVLLAKWLMARPRVLLVDEPTRGVDIGAKQEIYAILHDLAATGSAILLISSELNEILGLCHRIAVLRAGRIAGILDGPTATDRAVMELAAVD